MAVKKLRYNRVKSIVVQGGTITKREQRLFKNLVSRANRLRTKKLSNLRGLAAEKYQIFGKTSDFILKKQSYSFKQFESKKQFIAKMKYLNNIVTGKFEKRRRKIYKQNYKEALKNVYGQNETKQIRKQIDKMSEEEFAYRVETEQIDEISYQYYDPASNKLDRLQGQLNEKIYV